MLDFATLDFAILAEHSRHHCVAICSFLVPANLISICLVLCCVAYKRSFLPVPLVTLLSSIFAFALLAHVSTWFIIGTIALPTFILTGLSFICLTIDFWALFKRQQLQTYLLIVWQFLGNSIVRNKKIYPKFTSKISLF
jgi:hypothetical protein